MAEFFGNLSKDIQHHCANIDNFNKELLANIDNANKDMMNNLDKTNKEMLDKLISILSDIQKPITGKALPKSYNPYSD